MSPLLLHDSGRSGKVGWAETAIRNGAALGMILTPFQTPRQAVPRRDSAANCRMAIEAVGGEVFFDPMTHGVFAPGANAFDVYDGWSLWPGQRGVRTSSTLLGHVDRAVRRARELGVQLLSPTLSLDAPAGREAELAVEMAARSIQDEPAYISIVGSESFWSAGAALDAYVGELVSLRPAGWSVLVTRPALRQPTPGLDPAEVAGVCRTVHSLSRRGAPLIASHADLGGLPAVAAGATRLGSGWDLRHRVCAHDSFRSASGVRRAAQRVTHRGLLAWLKRDEAERLLAADAVTSRGLVQGTLPADFNAGWLHHLHCVSNRASRVAAAGSRQDRVNRLRSMYADARRSFIRVTAAAGPLEADQRQWIDPLAAGVEMYAAGEGW
jgi:hypothetical protein